ncbi:M13-type metalloendopeptidase [Roseateles sp.]|uniref:M13-type metalloendopeptidase n=1 Tax=Roseateles sp. TaxID=1971397 RepID=UPI0032665D28
MDEVRPNVLRDALQGECPVHVLDERRVQPDACRHLSSPPVRDGQLQLTAPGEVGAEVARKLGSPTLTRARELWIPTPARSCASPTGSINSPTPRSMLSSPWQKRPCWYQRASSAWPHQPSRSTASLTRCRQRSGSPSDARTGALGSATCQSASPGSQMSLCAAASSTRRLPERQYPYSAWQKRSPTCSATAARCAHSPAKYRVPTPMSNSPYFAQAFSCKPGSAMVAKDPLTVW